MNWTSIIWISGRSKKPIFCQFPNHNTTPTTSSPNNCRITIVNNYNLLHYCHGHLSHNIINKTFLLNGFPGHIIQCDSYFYAKYKCLAFSNSNTYSTKCFDLIPMDILGVYSIPYMVGYKHFLTTVYDHIRLCWIQLMKLKFETTYLIKPFISLIQTQFQTTDKTIRADNGPKLLLK